MPILAKEKDQDQRHAPASTAMSEAISPSIVRRSRKEEKGFGDKGSKGEGKGKGKEKGKKGEKGEKGSKGKPNRKRATEFSQQAESEAGSEIWSEPDVEEGGRLSMFASPSQT